MTLPDYVVDFRGHPACPCQAAWLPVFERNAQRLGLISGPLTIYQLIGNAPDSAGVHATGGAADWETHDGLVRLARDMGADATWHRVAGQAGPTDHTHSVLRGCIHNTPARYQIAAVDNGFNGLGAAGQGGPDDGPRPLSLRTFSEGIQWALQQEDDMPAPKDWDKDDWAAFKKNLVPQIATAVWMWDGFNKAKDKAKALLLLAAGK